MNKLPRQYAGRLVELPRAWPPWPARRIENLQLGLFPFFLRLAVLVWPSACRNQRDKTAEIEIRGILAGPGGALRLAGLTAPGMPAPPSAAPPVRRRPHTLRQHKPHTESILRASAYAARRGAAGHQSRIFRLIGSRMLFFVFVPHEVSLRPTGHRAHRALPNNNTSNNNKNKGPLHAAL